MSQPQQRTGALRIGVIGVRGVGKLQGGIEQYCSHFYRELCPYGFDVSIFVRRDAGPIETPPGIHTIILPVPRIRSLETVLHSFLSIIVARLLGIRTLHVHGIGPCVALPLARALGMRVVIRHVGADYDRTKWGSLARAMIRLGERYAARYGDSIVCLTPHIAKKFSEATGRFHDVLVIPNGVNAPPSTLSTDVLSCLGIVPRRYLLGVGRFVPEKNFHLLVDAFIAADLPPDVKLVLAGEIDYPGKYGRALLGSSASSNRVIMPGIVFGSDLWALYKNCAIFVLPSAHEGMSFALLEASIAGATIIASDIPANAAVCDEFARLVPVGSVTKLRDAIELEWQRKRAPAEIDRQVSLCKSRYDWRVIARSMVPVLAAPPGKDQAAEFRSRFTSGPEVS
jgi:glycosyltransferase involved in cell wall biosynthesis